MLIKTRCSSDKASPTVVFEGKTGAETKALNTPLCVREAAVSKHTRKQPQ